MTRQTDYLSFIPPSTLYQVMAAMDIEMNSPIGPLVAPGYNQSHAFGFPVSPSLPLDNSITHHPSPYCRLISPKSISVSFCKLCL